MVVMHPVSDMLIRIKNAYQVGKRTVEVDYSKILNEIAKLLLKEGYLKNIKEEKVNKNFKRLKLTLKYRSHQPSLTTIKIISKPGLRIYAKVDKIPQVREGIGITIVSTPKGLMTRKEARKANLGGEVICQIW